MSAHPLRIPVADLLRRPGASRAVTAAGPVDGLRTGATEVPPEQPVAVDVLLERVAEGIVVRGSVRAEWRAQCSRCLEPVSGDIAVHVDELYEPHPLDGETYALDDDTLDLEPLVRDALVLELPLAPVCDEACAGLCPTCGINRNEATCECVHVDTDPRWAALRALDL
jgi:uncharacterized protein